jgi:hypothetical protein
MENFLKFIKMAVFCTVSFQVCFASDFEGNKGSLFTILKMSKNIQEKSDLSKKEQNLLKSMQERSTDIGSQSTKKQPDDFSSRFSPTDNWREVSSQESTPDIQRDNDQKVNALELFNFNNEQDVIELYTDENKTLKTSISIENLRKELANSRNVFTYKSQIGEMDVDCEEDDL